MPHFTFQAVSILRNCFYSMTLTNITFSPLLHLVLEHKPESRWSWSLEWIIFFLLCRKYSCCCLVIISWFRDYENSSKFFIFCTPCLINDLTIFTFKTVFLLFFNSGNSSAQHSQSLTGTVGWGREMKREKLSIYILSNKDNFNSKRGAQKDKTSRISFSSSHRQADV